MSFPCIYLHSFSLIHNIIIIHISFMLYNLLSNLLFYSLIRLIVYLHQQFFFLSYIILILYINLFTWYHNNLTNCFIWSFVHSFLVFT